MEQAIIRGELLPRLKFSTFIKIVKVSRNKIEGTPILKLAMVNR